MFDKHYTLLLRQEKLAEMKGDGKRLPDSQISLSCHDTVL